LILPSTLAKMIRLWFQNTIVFWIASHHITSHHITSHGRFQIKIRQTLYCEINPWIHKMCSFVSSSGGKRKATKAPTGGAQPCVQAHDAPSATTSPLLP
jgi:hypothetical protein